MNSIAFNFNVHLKSFILIFISIFSLLKRRFSQEDAIKKLQFV